MSFTATNSSHRSISNLFSLEQNTSPLHDAVISQDLPSLRQLLTSNSYDIDVLDECGRTPLIYSIFVGSFVCFELLLQSGSNIYILDFDSKSPLHWACQLGRLRIVKYLISKGCDIYQKDSDCRTALHHATVQHLPKLLSMILKNYDQSLIDQPDSLGMSALHWSAYYNNSEACRMLIRNRSIPSSVDNEGRTPIHLCAGNDDCSSIKVFLEFAGQTILNLQDSQGCTLLHHIVAIQNVSLLSTITNPQNSSWLMNLNLDSKDLQHRTPLHWAFALGSSVIAGILISRGADWKVIDDNGYLPLHYAIERNFIDCIDCYFTFDFTDDLEDNNGRTCLMLSCQLGHHESTRAILERRISGVNGFSDKNGMSALHFASIGGNINCLKLLLQYGALVDMQDNHLRTSLSYACEYGYAFIVEYLINSGGLIDLPSIDGRLPIHYAALTNSCSTIAFLISKGNQLNTPDQMGRIPLHYACTLDNVELITMLGFAQINSQDLSGFTPLHWAVMHENIHTIKILVENDAKINVMDYSMQRRTPLDLSLFIEDREIYSFLRYLGCVTGIEIQTLAVIEIQRFWRHISRQRQKNLRITSPEKPVQKSRVQPSLRSIDSSLTNDVHKTNCDEKYFPNLEIHPQTTSQTGISISKSVDLQRVTLFHRKTEAALIIQLFWRKYLRNKQLKSLHKVEHTTKQSERLFEYFNRKREMAALTIQLAWRQFLRKKLLNIQIIKRKKLFQWSPGCLAIRQRLLIEQLYSQQFHPFYYTPSSISRADRPSFIKYIPSPAALSFNFAINQYCRVTDCHF
ncbi:Inversin 1 [Oopsacas minuta]|uniref:Inversin 1 n=1 Tax=Oopsacas minuta TaxID=111878 RepID=A0AAV7K4J6_9METZ|nr:Inversin 1 [Oopsacas minuta]